VERDLPGDPAEPLSSSCGESLRGVDGVLTAEMVGVNTGSARSCWSDADDEHEPEFLGMAMIGLVGYLLDAGLAVLQRRVLWWRSAAQV